MKSAEFDVKNLPEDYDTDLKEELQACQQFPVDSEFDKKKTSCFQFRHVNLRQIFD